MTDDDTLEARLARGRGVARERMPQYMELVDRMVAELNESVVENALGEGETAPDFALRRADNDEAVRLSEQLKAGPVVLSFYRGQW